MSRSAFLLGSGQMQFYDNALPGLPAGSYEISVTQELNLEGFSSTSTQAFEVKAPQFAIAPDRIHAMFPADNANGNFTLTLPSIVLNNRTLPWERSVGVGDSETPWLALLVFQEDEIEISPETASPLISSTVAEFFAEEFGVVKPEIDIIDLPPAVLASRMNSIRISTAVFQAVTPRVIELASLTHVREVDPLNQAESGDHDGWFSVVIANRFPASSTPSNSSGQINYVHLVSIEGLTQYLIDSPQWPTGAEEVQMVSLASWSFVSAEQPGETFSDLGKNLVTSTNGESTSYRLSIPVSVTPTGESALVLDGFTALSFHTAPGPKTFAWYRGPFVPFPARELPDVDEFLSASQATIYQQASAVFDHSYSAAWNIGRLTALSDPVFVDTIVRLRNGLLTNFRRLLERSKMSHLAGITNLKELAAPGLTRKTFVKRVKDGIAETLTNSFNQKSGADGPALKPQPTNFLFPDDDPPGSPAEEARWFLQKPEVRNFLRELPGDELDQLTDWFARLALLYNIPFNHLVPDQRMLPVESVRFFYVDQGWLKVLIDGAASVAINGSRDLDLHRIVIPGPTLPAAGMLLRSALVSGWPGLTVTGTLQDEAVNVMRMDRLATDVLLVLWDAIPDKVLIGQPPQGIVFGVEDDWRLTLRSLVPNTLGAQLDRSFPQRGTMQSYFRETPTDLGERVLNLVPPEGILSIDYLVPDLSRVLRAPLSPSQLAIELTQTPEQIVFNPQL